MQKEIAELEHVLAVKKRQLEEAISALPQKDAENTINHATSPETKIALFRSLFIGRDDVYAKRFESKKTGKSGYQPVCRNEWVQGICEKPQVSCGSCAHRSFEPVTDEVIRYHLEGYTPGKNGWGKPVPFVMGIYPLLLDETCRFLAIDFDKNTWQEDARAFMDTCKTESVPAALERSRSGNGAHLWIFFDKSVPAAKARKLGSFLLTRTLDRRPEIGLESFDRFFPNQDTLPKGGFGNLIALPLQKAAREKNHSLFLDENMLPHNDQWAFLASTERMNENQLDMLNKNAVQRNELLPVFYGDAEIEEEVKPWQRVSAVLPVISEPLPQKIEIVLADQLYVDHTGLPPILRNRILRLASFANPEFYRAQKMRLPTWNKPHILCCYEFLPQYIGLPVGCLDGLLEILKHYNIKPVVSDKQNYGQPIDVQFFGELREDQKEAGKKILAHQSGILSASTAFGKTVLALWLIAERKVNTLILVHRKILADQWAERTKVIIATGKYLGEGFDLPSLDTLFLVFPFSWKGMLTQYTGRLNRSYLGKKEILVYDYVDEKVPVLARMYGRRLKAYKSLGFTVLTGIFA